MKVPKVLGNNIIRVSHVNATQPAAFKGYWCFICLFIASISMNSNSTYALANVFLVTSPKSTPQLLAVSESGTQKLAELSKANVLYGQNASQLAILQSPGEHQDGTRLIVLEKETARTLVDTNIMRIKPQNRMKLVENIVAIDSKSFTVYFPSEGSRLHFAAVRWESAAAQTLPIVESDIVRTFFDFAAFPSGFAVMDFQRKIAVFSFSATTGEPRLAIQDVAKTKTNAAEDTSLYYVPTYGLMEYRRGAHYRLSDDNVSLLFLNCKAIQTSTVGTKIYARTSNGRPFLIWGETANQGQSPADPVWEIVMFDLKAETELLRKQIEPAVSGTICPDTTGARIYFITLKQGKLKYLDTKLQEVRAFSDIALPHPEECAILDAE
jgi:hypothetical protein